MRLIFRLSVAEGLCLFYSFRHLDIFRKNRSKPDACAARFFATLADAYSRLGGSAR